MIRLVPPNEISGSGHARQRQDAEHAAEVDRGLADDQGVTPAASRRPNGSAAFSAIEMPAQASSRERGDHAR